MSSAGEPGNVYEVESPGTCAVALYDYQGGGSAIQAVGRGTGSCLGWCDREVVAYTISSGEKVSTWWFKFLALGKQNET